MSYDKALADRIRRAIGGAPGITEQRMFGGLVFMLNGHVCLGVLGKCLIARVGPKAYKPALERPNVDIFHVTGRIMEGWVKIAPAGLEDEAAFRRWIRESARYVASMPPKIYYQRTRKVRDRR